MDKPLLFPEYNSMASNPQAEEQSITKIESKPKIGKVEKYVRASTQNEKKKGPRLLMCIANTKYEVVKKVAKKIFKFQLTKNEDADWDLCWQDGAIQTEQLIQMKPYKKINHFLGMHGLSRKDYLGRNLMKMRKLLPELYDFFPKTWVLPAEWLDFSQQFNGKSVFILKPEASCQGKGIFLTKRLEDVKQDQHYVGQQYIPNPYLIDKLKFDLRIYVLLYGCDPLRIFIYNEGLVRLATEEYKKPTQKNITDVTMHLTNYAINKNTGKFIFNKDADKEDYGHKRGLETLWNYIDKNEGEGKSNEIKRKIEDIIIKTICSIQPSLAHLYKSCIADDIDGSCCFEILGFDILLDKELNVWLLEVNHSPSLSTDTPLDWKIKGNLIADTLTLLNMTHKKKKLYLQNKKKELKRRIFCKSTKEHLDGKQEYRAKKYRIRAKFELSHLGGYKLIYPQPNAKEEYKLCLEKANGIYASFIGSNKKPDTTMFKSRGESNKSKIESFIKRPSTVKESFGRTFDSDSPSKKSNKTEYTALGIRAESNKLPKIINSKEAYNFIKKTPVREEINKGDSTFSVKSFTNTKEGTSNTEDSNWLPHSLFKGRQLFCHNRNGNNQLTYLEYKGFNFGNSQQERKALDPFSRTRKSTNNLTQAMLKKEYTLCLIIGRR